jgi:hypothetical protein
MVDLPAMILFANQLKGDCHRLASTSKAGHAGGGMPFRLHCVEVEKGYETGVISTKDRIDAQPQQRLAVKPPTVVSAVSVSEK